MRTQRTRLTRCEKRRAALTANTVYCKTAREVREEYMTIKDGTFYDLEVVRPMTREADMMWGNDGVRNINGQRRIVSPMRLFVNQVIRGGDMIRLICTGKDRYGRCANGTYIYYLTPDPLGTRDTYVLSLKEV